MQVSLNIKDDLYNRAIRSGIDMQSKFTEYLKNQLDKKDYLSSEQFQEDKTYFQNAYDELKTGKTEVLSHEKSWDEIEKHIDTL
jgi:hypothetical protein